MIEKELTIASDFPPVSYDKWRASVVTDLKGVPFEKKLIHRSLEGFDIQPLYTANDWPSDRDSSGFPGFLPLTRGSQALGTHDRRLGHPPRASAPESGRRE